MANTSLQNGGPSMQGTDPFPCWSWQFEGLGDVGRAKQLRSDRQVHVKHQDAPRCLPLVFFGADWDFVWCIVILWLYWESPLLIPLTFEWGQPHQKLEKADPAPPIQGKKRSGISGRGEWQGCGVRSQTPISLAFFRSQRVCEIYIWDISNISRNAGNDYTSYTIYTIYNIYTCITILPISEAWRYDR